MYSEESITKMLREAQLIRAKLDAMNVADIKIAISSGNRKIGRVMNVSLMPILTCKHCAECMWYCYDVKANLQYPNTVTDARMRNLVILQKDRNEFFRRIDAAMNRRRKNKYFRWHVAGDIIDYDYFDRMVSNARKHPDFVIWTYTKEYNVVNEWIANNGKLPDNFHVMFSEWRGLEMENPYHMPEFRVVFHDEKKPIGHYCPGNCDVCKASNRGCIAGETTYCMEH